MTDVAPETVGPPVRVPEARVALSTASCYPESVAGAFELASRLGYDGLEVMVWTDPISQDPGSIRSLQDRYQLPVVAVHAPCLLITQRVWGTDLWAKLERSVAAAETLGADTVVVHPPFRWQREYARGFVEGVRRLGEDTSVAVAVENMYPWRAGGREVAAYLPGWDVTEQDYRHLTLDLSHTAVSGSDALDVLDRMGERLAHVHLADGTGSAKDEHLVPGRGNQPCGAVLERLAGRGFAGNVVLEVSTRKALTRDQRESDLAEALAFARLHLAAAGSATLASEADGRG